jgi:hypothetical protein
LEVAVVAVAAIVAVVAFEPRSAVGPAVALVDVPELADDPDVAIVAVVVDSARESAVLFVAQPVRGLGGSSVDEGDTSVVRLLVFVRFVRVDHRIEVSLPDVELVGRE